MIKCIDARNLFMSTNCIHISLRNKITGFCVDLVQMLFLGSLLSYQYSEKSESKRLYYMIFEVCVLTSTKPLIYSI